MGKVSPTTRNIAGNNNAHECRSANGSSCCARVRIHSHSLDHYRRRHHSCCLCAPLGESEQPVHVGALRPGPENRDVEGRRAGRASVFHLRRKQRPVPCLPGKVGVPRV